MGSRDVYNESLEIDRGQGCDSLGKVRGFPKTRFHFNFCWLVAGKVVGRIALFIVCLLNMALLSPESAFAQKGRPIKDKSLQTPLDLGSTDFSFTGTFNRILSDSADLDLYDPLTIASLRRLKETAQPNNSFFEDIDPYETRRVVEKAFTIQTARSVIRQINESDLRSEYEFMKSSFDEFCDLFRFSVHETPDGVSVGKKRSGSKLLEMSLQFNLKQGMDPQIRIGDSVRFRYDYIEQAPTLEYFLDF